MVTSAKKTDNLHDRTVEGDSLEELKKQLPAPFPTATRTLIKLEMETLSTYDNGERLIIEGRAIAKGFPARELIGTARAVIEGGINANPRGVNPSNSIVREVTQTLILQPKDFYSRSRSPIVIYGCVENVSKLANENYLVTLSFMPQAQGLADGQHRLYAVSALQAKRASLSDVRIPLVIEVNRVVTPEEAENILVIGDTNRHKKTTRYNSTGKLEPFKEVIPPTWKIAYYENQPDIPNCPQCEFNHLLKLLGVLDAKKFDWQHKSVTHPVNWVTSTASHYDSMFQSALRLKHLIEDVVAIEEYLFDQALEYLQNGEMVPCFKLIQGSDESYVGKLLYLPTGKHYPVRCAESVVFPIVSAFRLWLDDNDQWVAPFPSFGRRLVNRLWSNVIDILDECGSRSRNPSRIFVDDKEYWRRLCAIALEYRKSRLGS
jgi:hypothetical protein